MPGIRNQTWLATRRDGRMFAVIRTFNDPRGRVPDNVVMSAITTRALELLADLVLTPTPA